MKRRSFLGLLSWIAAGAVLPRVVGAAQITVEDVLLVVTVKDRRNPNPNLAPGGYDRGDIVEVVPAGWNFSELEKSHDFWRIIPVSGMGMDRAQRLLRPGVRSVATAFDRRLPLRRALTLNLDALSDDIARYIADDGRLEPICPITLAISDVDAIVRFRPQPPDHLVIGAPHAAVIG